MTRILSAAPFLLIASAGFANTNDQLGTPCIELTISQPGCEYVGEENIPGPFSDTVEGTAADVGIVSDRPAPGVSRAQGTYNDTDRNDDS